MLSHREDDKNDTELNYYTKNVQIIKSSRHNPLDKIPSTDDLNNLNMIFNKKKSHNPICQGT